MKNKKKGMHKAREIFPGLEDRAASMKCMEAAKWLEQLPTSHLDFVEMGFDSLAQDLIDQLD